MTMRPSFGVSKPAISLSSVVLPQPDGPSSAKNSPRSIDKNTRSTAVTAPNRLLAPLISRSAIPGSAAGLHAGPGAGAGALIRARSRQVDIKQPFQRFRRVDARVIANFGSNEVRRREVWVWIRHGVCNRSDNIRPKDIVDEGMRVVRM